MKLSLAFAALVSVVHAVPFVVPPVAQSLTSFNNEFRKDPVEDSVRVVDIDDEIDASAEPSITPEFHVFIREIGKDNYTPNEKVPELEETDEMPEPSVEPEPEVAVRESSVEMAGPMSPVELKMDFTLREEMEESDEPMFSAEPLDAMPSEPEVRFPNNQRPFPV